MTMCHFAGALFFAIATSAFAAGEPAGPDLVIVVQNLYKAHDAQKGPFFNRQDRAALDRYFARELAALIRKDAIESKGEVGAVEFDPLYASQDPQVENLAFRAGQESNGRDRGQAQVQVTFKDNGKPRRIRLNFWLQPDDTWRVSDILYPDGSSLLQLLRAAYPPERGDG